MPDEVDYADMTALIYEENAAEKSLQEAESNYEKWHKRMTLAEEKGVPDLAAQAREQVLEAKAQRDRAQVTLERIEMEKKMLRKQANAPEAPKDTEALLESFREMGASPEEYELNQVAKEVAAGDALAALKAKMSTEDDL